MECFLLCSEKPQERTSGGVNWVGWLDAEKGEEPDGTEAGGDGVEDAGTWAPEAAGRGQRRKSWDEEDSNGEGGQGQGRED